MRLHLSSTKSEAMKEDTFSGCAFETLQGLMSAIKAIVPAEAQFRRPCNCSLARSRSDWERRHSSQMILNIVNNLDLWICFPTYIDSVRFSTQWWYRFFQIGVWWSGCHRKGKRFILILKLQCGSFKQAIKCMFPLQGGLIENMECERNRAVAKQLRLSGEDGENICSWTPPNANYRYITAVLTAAWD